MRNDDYMYVIVCPSCGTVDISKIENDSFKCIVCDEEFVQERAHLEEIKECE